MKEHKCALKAKGEVSMLIKAKFKDILTEES